MSALLCLVGFGLVVYGAWWFLSGVFGWMGK